MSIINKIKPRFWDHHEPAAGQRRSFSFRRKWMLMVVLTAIVALTPLLIMTYVDFRLTVNMLEFEARAQMEKTLSNTWRTLSFVLTQRRETLAFVARDNGFRDLTQKTRLRTVLTNLQLGIGGFEDIALLDERGVVRSYAGPHDLDGVDMLNDRGYRAAIEKAFVVTDERSKTGETVRPVIVVKQTLNANSFFMLRSSLDSALLNRILAQLQIGDSDDAFIVDNRGILQTNSRYHGSVGQKISLPISEYSPGANTRFVPDGDGGTILLGHANIPDTSLFLMIVKPMSEMLNLWYQPRRKLIGFLVLNIGLILIAILGTATYLVNRIHTAHRERMKAVHQVELSNKLASLGRLASGVAHEINNPLAIIDQKAGLIKDLLTIQATDSSNQKVLDLIEGVLSSVGRAGSVTKGLLNFARHLETKIERFDLIAVVRDLLVLLEQEADYKGIVMSLKAPDAGIEIESDQGSLQQIFLNIINNAFAAMPEGGILNIAIEDQREGSVSITVTDSGEGIPPEDMKHIFEPFFTTRSGQNSTGLGLSITYGLLQEIGGDIAVESKVGQGARFIITLPLRHMPAEKARAGSYDKRDSQTTDH